MSREKKGWTIKRIDGQFYLYTWVYDKRKSKEVREWMREEMRENIASTITPEDIVRTGSRYKWRSLGNWDLERPCRKLKNYITRYPEKVAEIDREVERRKEALLNKEKRA